MRNNKIKIYLTFFIFIIMNIISIDIKDKLIIGYPIIWFKMHRLYEFKSIYINILQLALNIIFCYGICLVILKIFTKLYL